MPQMIFHQTCQQSFQDYCSDRQHAHSIGSPSHIIIIIPPSSPPIANPPITIHPLALPPLILLSLSFKANQFNSLIARYAHSTFVSPPLPTLLYMHGGVNPISTISHLEVRRGDEGEPVSFPFFLELLLRFLRRLYVILEASAFYALSQSAKASTVPSVYASSPISSSTCATTVVCVASS